MFSFSQSDDQLIFQIHPFPHQQPEPIQQDLALTDQSSLDANNSKRPLTSTGEINNNDDRRSEGNANKQKKVMHREVERLRRQEMAKLYASLRSLLPLEFIKGKRSISDHMQEAVNYINHLQGSTRELEIKKNKLRKMLERSDDHISPRNIGSSSNCLANTIVKVTPCWCGVEILISSGEGFPLSRVMKVLVQERFNVMSCASTRVNEQMLHTVQSKASDPACIDVSTLQWKLSDILRV